MSMSNYDRWKLSNGEDEDDAAELADRLKDARAMERAVDRADHARKCQRENSEDV